MACPLEIQTERRTHGHGPAVRPRAGEWWRGAAGSLERFPYSCELSEFNSVQPFLEHFPYCCELSEFNQAQLFLTEKLR